ncbi:MAG: hypothetical protein ACRYGG_00140, partial [Janthinobacterium lividum]
SDCGARMMPLSPAERTRLACVLRLLGSDQPGERDAAGLAATRIVSCAGLDWDQLLQPVPAPRPEHARQDRPNTEAGSRSNVRFCLRYFEHLTGWEQGFVRSVSQRSTITSRQCVVLQQAADRLRARGFA